MGVQVPKISGPIRGTIEYLSNIFIRLNLPSLFLEPPKRENYGFQEEPNTDTNRRISMLKQEENGMLPKLLYGAC